MFLIICLGVLIICVNVILQSTVTVYSLKYLHKLNLKKQRLTFSEVLWQMATSVSFLTLLHGAQCTIWAATFYFNPNIDNLYSFQEAIYFSLITFTTVGYGDVVIDSEWKIMAGLEAINGIMMVGWSTALMFSYLQIILKKNITE
ncbi:potassium channel family protein [Empedobacter falsenii]